MMVSRIDDKKFVGKDIIYIAVWKKGDERTIYHMIYADLGTKRNYVKRFAVKSITREKHYQLSKTAEAKVLYFTAHANSESEVVSVQLSQNSTARQKQFIYDFGDLAIKGRMSAGNVISKYSIRKIDQKEVGTSTLGGVKIWVDEVNGRLNKDERGKYLGEFDTGDQILVLYKDGEYEQTNFDLSNHYDVKAVEKIIKLTEDTVVAVVYYDGESKIQYVKRFNIDTKTERTKYSFITEHKSSKINMLSVEKNPQIAYTLLKGKSKEKVDETMLLNDFIDVKNRTARGNKLTQYPIFGKIKDITVVEEIAFEEVLEAPEVVEKKVIVKKSLPTADENIDESEIVKKPLTKTEIPKKDHDHENSKDKTYKPGDTLEFDF
jgi:topoisomerase-4 subunit A